MKNHLYIIVAFLMLVISCVDSELITPNNEFNTSIKEESGIFTASINNIFADFSLGAKAVVKEDELFTIAGVSESSKALEITVALEEPLVEGEYLQEGQLNMVLVLDTTNPDNTTYRNFDEQGEKYPTVINITKIDTENFLVSGTFSATVRNISSGELLEITNGIFEDISIEGINNIEQEEELYIKYALLEPDVQSQIQFAFEADVNTEISQNNNMLISTGTQESGIKIQFPNANLEIGINETSHPSEALYSVVINYKGVEYSSIGGPLEVTVIDENYMEGVFNVVAEDADGINQITVLEGSFRAKLP